MYCSNLLEVILTQEIQGFIRLNEIIKIIPIGKSTIWKRVKEGTFPKPVKLSERTTAWKIADINKYIESLGSDNHA